MRQVYASPRAENVDRVEAMLNDAGIQTRVLKRDKINLDLRQILDDATDKWGVRVVRVEIQRIDPPPDVMHAMHDMAARMRRIAMISVVIGLIFVAYAYQTAKREAPVVAPETAPGMPPAAAPVYDNTVLLLDDSDSDTTEEPQ